MKLRWIQRLAAALACVGMMMPNAVFAAAPATSVVAAKAHVGDVALRADGLLVGQVVDGHAKPIAGTAVSVRLAGKEVVRATTDKNGVFAAKGLRSGQYQVVTSSGAQVYRLWAENTAPPTARTAAMLVSNNAVIAGQLGPGPIVSLVTQYPFLAAGVITGAVAGGIAAADDDDPAS